MHLSVLALFTSLSVLRGAQVTLTWNPNTETNLAGYKVYWSVGTNAPSKQDVGLQTTTVVSNLTIGTGYLFYATAYNAAGLESPPSAPVRYTVPTAPVITSQPANQTIVLGSPVTFSAQATSSIPVLLQWYFGGSAIANATNNSYSIAAVRSLDAGAYSISASNNSGVALSSSALLSVVLPPSIAVQPANQTVLAGAPWTLSVQASGTAPLVYQWFRGGTPLSGATASTLQASAAAAGDAGSYTVQVANAYGTVTSSAAVLTVIIPPTIQAQPLSTNIPQGAALNLAIQAAGSTPLQYQWFKNGVPLGGATSASLQISSVQASDAGNYFGVVSNPAGSVTSVVATVSVILPPSITVQPAGKTLLVGAVLNLSVTATGTDPLQYQWFKNGISIAGATSASYQIASVQLTDAADYSVSVTNPAGSVTSGYATVIVNRPPPAAPTGLRVLN